MDPNNSYSYQEIDPPVYRTTYLWQFLRSSLRTIVTLLAIVAVLVLTLLSVKEFGDNTSSIKTQFKTSLVPRTNEPAPLFTTKVIELKKGRVFGKVLLSRGGRRYGAFLGIPYATPPVGHLRFQPTVGSVGWNGTLSATKFKPYCPQRYKHNNFTVVIGSEDCLYLNIFTPRITQDSKLSKNSQLFPVMVYIHGGGDQGEVRKYGADYFMDENVILVMFHYRLGVLGNLNTEEDSAQGNQGNKDQVMVLQWVRENIERFGGDKNKVTIFGESGGGMHVTAHLLSPMSSGLFHRAISQSNVEISPTVFTQYPIDDARELAERLNCSANTSYKQLAECFLTKTAQELILHSDQIEFHSSKEIPSEDAFLTDLPLKLLQIGQLNSVPVIFGVTAAEGVSFSLPLLASSNETQRFNDDWVNATTEALWLDNSPTLKNPEVIAEAVHAFYLDCGNVSRAAERNFTRMFTDRRNLHPAKVFADFQLKKNKRNGTPVFLYHFSEPVQTSYSDKKYKQYGYDSGESLGPAHGDELQFLFPHEPFPNIPLGSENAALSKQMVRWWVNFAETGSPTRALDSSEWLPIKLGEDFQWFDISSNPIMTKSLADRIRFWDSFNLTDLYV